MLNKKEEVLDFYLKLVGDQHAYNINEEIENDRTEIEKIDYPKSLDVWFENFNKKRHRKQQFKNTMKKIYKTAPRVAAIIITTILLFGIVTFSVEAFRLEFLNFFIKEESKSINIKSSTESQMDEILDTYENIYIFDYVPNGYVLEDVSGIEEQKVMIYSNEEKSISFMQHKGELDISIDNERMKVSYGQLKQGEKAVFSESEDYNSIIWENGSYTFSLSGPLDLNELKKMAESLILK